MTVLVTGATGFVGRALLARLAGEGRKLAAAVRHDAKIAGVETRPVGDIGPGTDWRRALEGVDAVVHLAARAHLRGEHAADPLAAFRAVNRDGARRLAQQAAEAGVARLVFLSSVKAMGESSPPGRGFLETDACLPEDGYGVSKLEAEQALGAVAQSTGLGLAILRPPLVYGPGVGGNMAALLRLCDGPWPLPLGGIANARSLVALDNLVEAIVLCLDRTPAAGRVFLVRDGEDLSTGALVARLRRALGRPARLVPQLGLLAALARLPGLAPRLRPLVGSLRVDDAAIRAALGYRPKTGVDRALDGLARWWQGRHDRACRPVL